MISFNLSLIVKIILKRRYVFNKLSILRLTINFQSSYMNIKTQSTNRLHSTKSRKFPFNFKISIPVLI